MWADFAEVGTADFSEICPLFSVAGEAPLKIRCAGALLVTPYRCFTVNI